MVLVTYSYVKWFALLGAVCGIALALMLLPLQIAPVLTQAPLAWYLNEACQTGDVVFFVSPHVATMRRMVSPVTHVGLIVMHPVSGEPWLVEFLEPGTPVFGTRQKGGFNTWPARDRLHDAAKRNEGLLVSGVRRPLQSSAAWQSARHLGRSSVYPRSLTWHFLKCKLLCWLPLAGSCPPASHLMCSEYVAKLLCEFGTLEEWRCLSPTDLLQVTQSRLEKFSEPAWLVM